jgi:hypothetical protein
MSEQVTGEGAGLSDPIADAPLVGEAPPERAPKSGWRSPVRIAAVTTALAVVVAAAIVIPMKLTSARSVSAAMGGVFQSSTVGFSLSTSAPQLGAYSLDLILASSKGGPVSQAKHLESDLSIVDNGALLAEMRETEAGLFVRLNPYQLSHSSAFGMQGSRFLRRLHQIASRHRRFAFLGQLADGRWVGIKRQALHRFDRRLLHRLGLPLRPAKSRRLAKEVGTSFGQAWDEWASLHQVSSQNGTTEYSVELPVRSFATSLVHSLSKDVTKSLPALGNLFGNASSALSRIPAAEKLPVDLWIAGGELTKVSVSAKGQSLTAAISHPPAPTTPSSVTYVKLRGLLGGFPSFIGHSYGGSVPMGRSFMSPPGALAGAQLAVLLSYQATRSFADLFNASSPHSVYAIEKKLGLSPRAITWRPDAPSMSTSQVSASVVGQGAAVVLVTERPAARRCAGMLYVGGHSKEAILGSKRRAGSVVTFSQRLLGGSCNAADITAVPAHSSLGSGWTGYSPLQKSSSPGKG